MENGFKIKMPYADRCDKQQKTRTINFYCHMSKSANRKVLTNSCPFRAIFKMKMGYLKQQRDIWVKTKKDECDRTKHEMAFKSEGDASYHYFRKDDDLISLLNSIDWTKVFELHKLFNLHNHEMINYKTLQTVKHPLVEPAAQKVVQQVQ